MFVRIPFARILLALLLIGFAMSASSQTTPQPNVPANIAAPANTHVVLMVHATGNQIYTCANGADGKTAWTLKEPQAELRDKHGKLVGHHSLATYETPAASWKHADGSEVIGRMAARADAPNPNDIPWLLVNAIDHKGTEGALSGVTHIQRLNTKGGKAPVSGCDAQHPDAEVKVPYTADYYFYAPQ
jgi:hypothetical protein